MDGRDWKETLDGSFLRVVDRVLRGARESRDLALAMGDAAGASKEEVKIAALEGALAPYREALGHATLAGARRAFLADLAALEREAEAAIARARRGGDKEALVAAQIRRNVLGGPVGATFRAACRRAGARGDGA